ncbi:MAG: hypothetical protein A3F82_02530 [Deltaproteobacteria bacterium RIFCSPLOWO2_12_FULL_44_12]|nr:MAG: hypothetical protein A2712_02425 [Deltaproteobacteria bacterium RIFCSPHIGHO2_01_FULL_43_49]OGQ16051.1 MAG: hypothetical protein A3D22_00395 [Deltaproteobacteria bacterium RIFCSPHIGHO2_02_FULL_44_53]OGQ29012.1 MAG: hypothetical protein A3D98_04180 [Deltaproteobacteria bacterium RIFCSPHIGHO2_12_FULL_44_21]OGQ32568.1 MAG: hypothetical protein A2979_08325 [Deltaproteobacteria bacterium RIFCSPLOWO2_01_FULL_45_74]OGQ41669.1 MAG: hypothetical protein A3I70_08110 [Deltaproteobacteria bacterium 
MIAKQWFVLQSKPQKENVVCSQLARLEGKVECFFPRIRSHLGIKPLFPSYLFVSFLPDSEHFRLIKYTRGTLRILGSRGGEPLPVTNEIVATVKNKLGPDGLIDQRGVYPIGKVVKVRRGPLKDLIGILEKPTSEVGRVQVLFRLLRYPLRAALKFEDLEAA